MLGFLLEQSTAGRWVFRRHPAINAAAGRVGTTTPMGVAVVRPEIALLFKAKGSRFKDQRDFDRALPHPDRTARAWLAIGAGPGASRTPGVAGCELASWEADDVGLGAPAPSQRSPEAPPAPGDRD